MAQTAGIVLWRSVEPDDAATPDQVEVLLAHPGGPFWSTKDQHAWSIPKGEFDSDAESAWPAALREFEEELGVPCPTDGAITIPPFRAGKKMLHAWLVAGDFDPTSIGPDDVHRSMVEIEWPPRSGSMISFPEIDRVEWVLLDRAVDKLHKGQAPLVDAIRLALQLP